MELNNNRSTVSQDIKNYKKQTDSANLSGEIGLNIGGVLNL
jgi:hypothetical protein